MQTSKKKPSILFILFVVILSVYLGYLIGGAWEEGIEAYTFLENFNEVCANPVGNYFNQYTFQSVLSTVTVAALVVLMYYTSRRNLMPGKEFGTAKLETPQKANQILSDQDESFNRILSQNVKMSLDFRRLKLNGNILICGGSGAGKTFYEVKPNLMQMPRNCSFICTDPKGGAGRSAMKSSGTVLLNY